MNSRNNFYRKKPFKIAIFASLGSGLEYYDFVIYGMMAKYLGDIFFTSESNFSGVMQAFSIFATGYVIRPFGGTIFGMVADTYGRKKSFVIVMLSMAISTLVIGLLPTYEQVGIIAPVLLVICRLLQGISFGAELPSATTIVSESGDKRALGGLCSFILSSTSFGSLLAAFVLTILTNLFSYKEIIEGAWRIPFLLGGVLAIVAYYIRSNISETVEFLESDTSNNSQNLLAPFFELVKHNVTNVLIGFGLTFFLSTAIIVNLYFPMYINKYFSYELADIYRAMTGSMLASFFFMLVFGWLSDQISKIKLLLFSLLGFGISLYPLYLLLNQQSFIAIQLFFIIYQLWISVFFTSYLPILSRLFSTNIRCTGTALTYNISFSIASIIPIICTYFFADYKSPLFLGIFFIVAIGTALMAIITLILQGKRHYAY